MQVYAGERFIVEVTPQDILNGKRHDSYRCPIALAINRQFATPGYRAKVSKKLWRWETRRGVCIVYPFVKLPKKAQQWIHRFDHRKPVGPTQIEMTS